eukprot:1995996-Pleurochrysis_carterae.AAC.1
MPEPFGPDMVDASTQSELLDALLDALIKEREVARSFDQAATHVSDPHPGVKHYHPPHRASGSGVSTVSKLSGPCTVNTPTLREPLEYLTSRLKICDEYESGLLARVRAGLPARLKHRHTSKRASRSGKTPKATVPSGTDSKRT